MRVGVQRYAPTDLPLEGPSTHRTGGWLGHRAGLDERVKFHPHRGSKPELPGQ
jgi:hypothetical protein